MKCRDKMVPSLTLTVKATDGTQTQGRHSRFGPQKTEPLRNRTVTGRGQNLGVRACNSFKKFPPDRSERLPPSLATKAPDPCPS